MNLFATKWLKQYFEKKLPKKKKNHRHSYPCCTTDMWLTARTIVSTNWSESNIWKCFIHTILRRTFVNAKICHVKKTAERLHPTVTAATLKPSQRTQIAPGIVSANSLEISFIIRTRKRWMSFNLKAIVPRQLGRVG